MRVQHALGDLRETLRRFRRSSGATSREGPDQTNALCRAGSLLAVTSLRFGPFVQIAAPVSIVHACMRRMPYKHAKMQGVQRRVTSVGRATSAPGRTGPKPCSFEPCRLALQVERAKLEAYFAERGFVRRCAPAADAQGWELYARPVDSEGKIDRWKRNSSAELLLRQPATVSDSLASAAAANTIHGLAIVVAKDKVASVAEAEVLGAIIAQLETNTHPGDSALEEEE